MYLDGSAGWRRVLPERVTQAELDRGIAMAGYFLGVGIIVLAVAILLGSEESTSGLRLFALVVLSGVLGAIVRISFPLAVQRRRDIAARPAVVASLMRIRNALDENREEREILELIARGALTLTQADLSRLSLPSGLKLELDRSGARWTPEATTPAPVEARGKATDGSVLKAELVALGETLGVLEVVAAPGRRFEAREGKDFAFFAGEASVAVKNAALLSGARSHARTLQTKISELEWWQSEMEEYARDLGRTHHELHQVRSDLEETYMATLEALASAVDARDPYTYGHCRRVAELASAVAKEMGLPDADRHNLEQAALLHDIGKMGVPDNTLRKTSSLCEEEWVAIQQHPEMGFRMLSALRFLDGALPAIRYHHERFDGKGYPYGLSGEAIPLPARILSAADAYDAITSDRPYRSARSTSDGIAEITSGAGSQFDPMVAEVLSRILVARDDFLAPPAIDAEGSSATSLLAYAR